MSPGNAHGSRPRVVVAGLWHLGTVIAACVANEEWPVLGVDPDLHSVAELQRGRPPVAEPGLEDLVRERLQAGSLDFGLPDDPRVALAEIVWIAFDTPVDEEDRADVAYVLDHATAVLEHAAEDALVVISSQLPVGSAEVLSARLKDGGRAAARVACVPENLRLGRAIETFSAPERFVAGVRSERDRDQLAQLLERWCDRIEWMRVESAEMTKHALNAFLATSVAFINEIAGICERVRADASEVARGLKSERRIGPGAYLSPGDAFAGGTLARDITFLTTLAGEHDVPAYVATGVAASNDAHRAWARQTLRAKFGGAEAVEGLAGRRIGLWGLTYKPGTDTLRRSSAIELARWLVRAGVDVIAYDPAIIELPLGIDLKLELAATPVGAVEGADALVVSTPWPEFRNVPVDGVVSAMRRPLILDSAGFMQASVGRQPAVEYVRVGSPLT